MTKTLFALCLGLGLLAPAAELSVLLRTDRVEGLGEGWGYAGMTRRLERADDSTDGDGSIRLAATSTTRDGSHYVSFWFNLPEPVDLRHRRLVFDARTGFPASRGFYVRLYNRGEREPAWSFNSWNGAVREAWQTFSVQEGLCLEGLAWEAAVTGDRKAGAIERIEFIVGTREKEAEFDLFVDHLRIGPRVGTLATLDTYKTILPTTPLVVDGQAVATILHPDTAAGRAAAETVAAAVRGRTGVALPARPGTAADREPGQPAILLGSVFTNPALLLLYARRLTPVDGVCPGAGGALLHTVSDPFGKGANLLVLGAADEAGLARAAEEFARLVAAQPAGTRLELPRLFAPFYGADFLARYRYAGAAENPKRVEEGLAAGRRTLERGTHCSIAADLANVATRYLLTGHASEARLYVALWDLYAESAVADPRKYGGPWGFDSDFPSQSVVAGWDLIEEDPSLTDEERLRTARNLARWLTEAVMPKCAGAATSPHVPHNHQTFPALGMMQAGLYYSQGFDVVEGTAWLNLADAVFRRQATYFKPYEDCNGYQWLTNGHLFRYALARPDFAIFENGNGQRIIDFLVGNMDNLGIQVPYGDTGSWKCWDAELICLEAFAFATGDPEAAWTAAYKRRMKEVRPAIFDFAVAAPEAGPAPTRFNGVRLWPLEPAYYATFPAPARPPLEACFDKISFRESLDPAAAYLLLDGLGNGGHRHDDANSIPRITQFDRIWLADNDYFKSHLKFHNSMQVFKDGQSGPLPAYIELLGCGESARYGYSQTRANDYAGVDWERTVVWLKPLRSFLVLDRLTARAADEYQFRLLWHGIGAATLEDHGLSLRQNGPGLRIQLAPGPELVLADDHELGTNWRGYPHAAPVVRSLSAIANVRLAAGESYLFATVLHGAPGDLPPAWTVQLLEAGDGVLVDTPLDRLAVGLGPVRLPAAGGQFASDARVLVADGGLSLLGASRATFDGEVLHASPAPTSLDLPDAPTHEALAGLRARAPIPNLAAGTDAAALETVWETRPRPGHALLTGNTGLPGALPRQPELAADPAPAEQNVFSPAAANRLDSLLDGLWKNAGECVMFEPDRKVVLTLRFQGPAEVRRVAWKHWWAATSSKQTAYQLAGAEVFLSNDDFQTDRRLFGSLRDEGPNPDWGEPRDYALEGAATATAVRLEFTPHPGTAVYLAELLVFGESRGEDVPGHDLTRLAATRDGLLAGTRAGDLLRLDPATGRVLAGTRLGGTVNDLAVADLDGDGSEEIIVGRQDHWLTVLGADFAERWSRQLQFYRKAPAVNVVFAGDLDGDGRPEVVCGADNWRFYAFSADGDELWNYESVHPSRSGAVADLDGDGKAEVICGTHYYWASVLNGTGTRRWQARFGPICHAVAVGSFAGDRTRGVVFGGGDGAVHAFDHAGRNLATYNTGDEVVTVAALDLDGDGRDEFAAGSLNHSVYAFNAAGERLWRTDLGSPLVRIHPLPAAAGNLLAAITAGGRVAVLDAAGRIVARAELGAPLVDVLVRDGDVVVADGTGRVARFRLPTRD